MAVCTRKNWKEKLFILISECVGNFSQTEELAGDIFLLATQYKHRATWKRSGCIDTCCLILWQYTMSINSLEDYPTPSLLSSTLAWGEILLKPHMHLYLLPGAQLPQNTTMSSHSPPTITSHTQMCTPSTTTMPSSPTATFQGIQNRRRSPVKILWIPPPSS